MTLITDIAKSIHLPDVELDIIIQNFIDGPYNFEPKIPVQDWRVMHYQKLRKWAYPDFLEYMDAQVKLSDSKIELKTEGSLQLNNYTSTCLAVKSRFPKGK